MRRVSTTVFSIPRAANVPAPSFINNLGQVVGYAQGPEHLHNGADLLKLPQAFLSAPNGGAIRQVGPSYYDISYAFGVNDLGQTVGRTALNISMDVGLVTGPNGARLPLEIETPTGTSLNGAPYMVLRDINKQGQILGYDVFGTKIGRASCRERV